jgi:hypothetical protein
MCSNLSQTGLCRTECLVDGKAYICPHFSEHALFLDPKNSVRIAPDIIYVYNSLLVQY